MSGSNGTAQLPPAPPRLLGEVVLFSDTPAMVIRYLTLCMHCAQITIFDHLMLVCASSQLSDSWLLAYAASRPNAGTVQPTALLSFFCFYAHAILYVRKSSISS